MSCWVIISIIPKGQAVRSFRGSVPFGSSFSVATASRARFVRPSSSILCNHFTGDTPRSLPVWLAQMRIHSKNSNAVTEACFTVPGRLGRPAASDLESHAANATNPRHYGRLNFPPADQPVGFLDNNVNVSYGITGYCHFDVSQVLPAYARSSIMFR